MCRRFLLTDGFDKPTPTGEFSFGLKDCESATRYFPKAEHLLCECTIYWTIQRLHFYPRQLCLALALISDKDIWSNLDIARRALGYSCI